MTTQRDALPLGQKLAEAKPGLISFYILLVAGVALAACGASSLLLNIGSEPSRANLITAVVLFLLGGLAAWLGYNRTRRHVEQLAVYEHGLLHVKAGQTKMMPWDEVSAIYKTTFVNNQGRKQRDVWTVVNHQGEQIRLGDKAALGHVVEEKMWPRLWQRITADLSQGKNVNFGPVYISRLGISHQEDHVPWQALQKIQFGPFVTVFTDSKKLKWRQAMTRNIPNLPLLKQAIDSLQQAA